MENAWIGQVLANGNAVRLSITGPCPRCVMTTLPYLRAISRRTWVFCAQQSSTIGLTWGVYASVLQGKHPSASGY